MTLAEVVLLVAVGAGIYQLLRPVQRALERLLIRRVAGRHPRLHRPAIDVTSFTSPESSRKDDDQT